MSCRPFCIALLGTLVLAACGTKTPLELPQQPAPPTKATPANTSTGPVKP